MATYEEAGVDIKKGNQLVERIKALNPNIGQFSGLHALPNTDLLLAGSIDGVGTKLKLAHKLNTHTTIGQDLVAMNVNDLITCGAKPLFFLDYYGTNHLDVDTAFRVIKSIYSACQAAECTLLGGETAEMPQSYQLEYELVGAAIGIVHKDKVIDGSTISAGDMLIGLPSSGVHSNGYSLVRKIIEEKQLSLDEHYGLETSLGEELLKPTTLYVKTISSLLEHHTIKGLAHITGGGFMENIPRMLPSGLGARINGLWPIPPIFSFLEQQGSLNQSTMYTTFNMGIGIVLATDHETANAICAATSAYRIGEVITQPGVHL